MKGGETPRQSRGRLEKVVAQEEGEGTLEKGSFSRNVYARDHQRNSKYNGAKRMLYITQCRLKERHSAVTNTHVTSGYIHHQIQFYTKETQETFSKGK